jgi:hypothetical protein
MSIAGQISPKMLTHYSHVRMDAKRKALDALTGGVAGVVMKMATQNRPPVRALPRK